MADLFLLYYHPYSVCSIMVRYTLAVAGEARDGVAEMHVEEKMVDIFQYKQLEEQFLRGINPKGQVRRTSPCRVATIHPGVGTGSHLINTGEAHRR